MSIYKSILIAVDISRQAEDVIKRAMSVASEGARFQLLHVVEPVIAESDMNLTPTISIEVEQAMIERAENFLKQLISDCSLSNVSSQVLLGGVKQSIHQIAEDMQADLVVIGSHGRHGLGLLMGSTANAVLHGAGCDVLAVRV